MKILIKIATVTGVALLLSGCTSGSTFTGKQYAYDINKRHIAQYDENNYYYRPNNSWSVKLDANTAHINSVASSGLLKCKENDIWFISLNEREEEGAIRYRYLLSLAKLQLMDMKDDASYIPRRDSREFKDLIDIDTQMVRQGLIGCSKRMSKTEVSHIRTSR